MNVLYYPILVPLAAGVLCLLLVEKLRAVVKVIALLASAAFFGIAIWLFNTTCTGDYLAKDGLSTFILLAVGLFGVATVLYSLRYMSGRERQKEYYSLILLTLAGAATTVLANNLLAILIGWGFLGITLYLLIAISGSDAATAAKKTLIVVGGTDALMLMGIVILAFLAGTWTMSEIAKAPLGFTVTDADGNTVTSGVAVLGFLFLALACFAKAGAMPLHTWIPDMAVTSPATVTAFLPASLDKLLGIYLLAKVSTQLFVFTPGWGLFLMIIGAATILGAVMMALVQHDLRKLLSYHAVSQVGYMVLGIGTGNPIGIAGGVFHMLNHSIYKSCLFFCGGAVEHRTGTNELDRLGGLARYMPITFAACLVAALSISGVPPFNGFFSKWMVYQGVIQLGESGGKTWVIWLVAAMFGSALTLASFTKLIYAIFLGQKPAGQRDVREVSFLMWVPMAALALLCIAFGVFAYSLPMKYLVLPGMRALGVVAEGQTLQYAGVWWSGWATLMILAGILLGFILYLLGNLKGFRSDSNYLGGELFTEETRVTGVDFYGSVKDMPGLKGIYARAEEKAFDLYEQGKKLTFCISDKLKEVHTGVLRTYLAWCLIGALVLLLVLML